MMVDGFSFIALPSFNISTTDKLFGKIKLDLTEVDCADCSGWREIGWVRLLFLGSLI
jgi:hypothetical protein